MRGKGLAERALVGALIWGLLAAAIALGDPPAPPPPQPPPELWSQPEDAELAALIADIFLLRQINEAGLTRDQIGKLLPVLEGMLRDAERLRAGVKARLLEERRLLLQGKQTAKSAEAAKREIQQSARRFAEEARKSLDATRSFLSPGQVERLTHILIARPGGFFRRAVAGAGERRHRPPAGRDGSREPERRGPEVRPDLGPRGLGGPSTVVLRRLIQLLQEKLRVM